MFTINQVLLIDDNTNVRVFNNRERVVIKEINPFASLLKYRVENDKGISAWVADREVIISKGLIKKHYCSITQHAKRGDNGAAIFSCWTDKNGILWVDNDEYSNEVKYCPFCGASANNDVPVLATRVNNMNFSIRTLNCLKVANIDTLGQLIEFRITDLRKFRTIGKTTIKEIEKNLETRGYSLKSF